jgi:hypothetical protein
MREGGLIFGDLIELHNPAAVFVGAYLSWRMEAGQGYLECGVRARNLFDAGFRDRVHVVRFDDEHIGGALMGRRVFLFVRGAL